MRVIPALPCVLAVMLAACGNEPTVSAAPAAGGPASAPVSSSDQAADARPAGLTAEPDTGVEITTRKTRFGQILFDGGGQAIYFFDKEKTGKPGCYDACAEAWPPVLTRDAPQAGGEVRSSLLGETRRSDGQTQVTYAGRPLYYYAHEGKNEVECHNVREFGGLWLAVTPSGSPAD